MKFTISMLIFTPVLANLRNALLCTSRRGPHGKRSVCTRPLWPCQAQAPQIPGSHVCQPSRFRWRWSTSRTQRCVTRVPTPLLHTTDIEHRIIFTAFEPFSYQARGNALFLLECGNTGLNSLLLGHAHALVGLVTPLYIRHFALVFISYRFLLLSFAFHPCSGVSVTSSTHRIHIT